MPDTRSFGAINWIKFLSKSYTAFPNTVNLSPISIPNYSEVMPIVITVWIVFNFSEEMLLTKYCKIYIGLIIEGEILFLNSDTSTYFSLLD